MSPARTGAALSKRPALLVDALRGVRLIKLVARIPSAGGVFKNMTIKLWFFPASQFGDWCKLVGSTELRSHAGYMAMIAATQADLERQGHVVERVGMFVDAMIFQLEKRELANTPDNRALIIAEEPPMKSLGEWRFEFHVLAAAGRLITDLESEELLAAIINWAGDRGLFIVGGFRPPDEPSPLEPFQD